MWLNRHIKIMVIGILVITVAAFSFASRQEPKLPAAGNEITQILATSNLKEQVRLYRALITRVGPEQAQEDLYKSGLPFTGETHLLNHTVGDMIYEKDGLAGITKCRNYFLESCYHGLLLKVIGGSADKDIEEVTQIMQHCEAAGPSVPAQCAHGIGHGYVAAVGYANLDRGLKQCEVLAEKVPAFPLYNCLDGGFMENIWAVHEGEPSPERWVKEADNFYPCNDPRLQSPAYGDPCWSNQPSLLYQRFQGDLKKVGEICLIVTPGTLQSTCFNGLSRQIHPLTKNKLDKVISHCAELPSAWQSYCRTTIVTAAFSVGDRSLPFELCAQADGEEESVCYSNLTGSIHGSTNNADEKRNLCNRIAETDKAPREQCLAGV